MTALAARYADDSGPTARTRCWTGRGRPGPVRVGRPGLDGVPHGVPTASTPARRAALVHADLTSAAANRLEHTWTPARPTAGG
jgi:hypothetical protein